jgi:hypothetical protein
VLSQHALLPLVFHRCGNILSGVCGLHATHGVSWSCPGAFCDLLCMTVQGCLWRASAMLECVSCLDHVCLIPSCVLAYIACRSCLVLAARACSSRAYVTGWKGRVQLGESIYGSWVYDHVHLSPVWPWCATAAWLCRCGGNTLMWGHTSFEGSCGAPSCFGGVQWQQQ